MNNLRLGILVVGAVIGAAVPVRAQAVEDLLKKNKCTLCHSVNTKMAGPSYKQIAEEYGTDGDAPGLLAERIKNGSARIWGPSPMPAFPKLPDAEVNAIVKWILAVK